MTDMDLQEARRMLATFGVPDLEAELAEGWQSMETGPVWALEEDLVKMPPQRREFPDEDALSRYLVLRQLNTTTPPPIPAEPAPARPWSVVREPLSSGPGLRWSTRLVTGSTVTAVDSETLLVRDVSGWWDHQLCGAVVIRTVDLATGEESQTRFDNDLFALGPGPSPQVALPRWAHKSVPRTRSANPRQDLAVMVRPAPIPAGGSQARFVVVRHDDIRHPADGFRLEVWGAESG